MPNLRRKIPSANSLFVFESAARCGNFTRAAAEMGVTQPAVSRMLSLLEDHLEVRLFDRKAGKALLTEYGEILYKGVKEGFQSIDTALQDIENRRSGEETVTLSVSTAFTTHWLMPRMHKLQAAFPDIDIRFQLVSSSLTGPVDDVDLGMRFVSGEDLSHGAELLMPELLMLVCNRDYHKAHFQHSDAADNAATYISLTDARTNWREYFDSIQQLKLVPHSLEFSDYAIVLQAALQGQGFAVGWINIISNWLCTGALVPVSYEVVKTGRLCHLIYSRQRPLTPAAAKVCDWIINETHAEMRQLDQLYPQLGIAEVMDNLN